MIQLPLPKLVWAPHGVLCGIAQYTSDLVANSNFTKISASPESSLNSASDVWATADPRKYNTKELDKIITLLRGGVLWIQQEGNQTQGINPLEVLIPQLEYLHRKGGRVYITPHSIHFEKLTSSGMLKFQEALIRDALPLVEKMVFLTEGAYHAAREFASRIDEDLAAKCDIIYHGVHYLPQFSRKEPARREFFRYYGSALPNTTIHGNFTRFAQDILEGDALWILAYGILNSEKSSYLPQLRADVENLLGKKVYASYVGAPHPKADPNITRQTQQFLIESAKDKRFIYIQQKIPDEKLPFVIRSPDIISLYEPKGTQSGRLAYAVAFPSLILANNEEGTGMMWRMYGFERYLGNSLAETAANLLTLELDPKKQNSRMMLEERRLELAELIGWPQQGYKHTQLAKDPDFEGTDIGLYEAMTRQPAFTRFRNTKELKTA